MASPGPANVVARPGRLPAFFDRSVVFFANLLGLFFGNEAETRLLAEEVGELDSYGGRLIPLIDLIFRRGGNTLVLEREPDPRLCQYFAQDLRLSLPRVEVLSHKDYLALGEALRAGRLDERLTAALRRIMGGSDAAWVDGYVTDDTLSAFAARTGLRTVASGAGSRRGNNKRLLHEFLLTAGLPVLETRTASSLGEVEKSLARLAAAGFATAVVKAAVGASGIGMVKLPTSADAAALERAVPGAFFYEGACLVQGWLEPGRLGVARLRSPSVQIFVGEAEVSLYDVTEQILSEASVHQGNESPPPYLGADPALREELLRQAGLAGKWLHGQGYRGTGSVDFLVVDREAADREVYVCEINARVTGATYPAVLARHFAPDGAWLLRNLRFRSPISGNELFATLERSGRLFDPERGECGLLPINFNFGRDGLVHKAQFLFLARSSAQSRRLLDLAEIELPCVSDRD